MEKIEIGLIENMTLFFVNKQFPILKNIPSKVDSGNQGYCVLHGIVVDQDHDKISFRTVGNKLITMKKIEDIIIHIGSGNKEIRPVVLFDVEVGGKKFKKIPFSLADRSQNNEPILISEEFISNINALIDVNKKDVL